MSEVAVNGAEYWAANVSQLAQLLSAGSASVIPDPTGRPVDPSRIIYVTGSLEWAGNQMELRDALLFSLLDTSAQAAPQQRRAAGAVAPVEQRLVFTVEEAATLLGISRTFAYEAVKRGDIPSMRIGKRILVPKAALQRFLDSTGGPA